MNSPCFLEPRGMSVNKDEYYSILTHTTQLSLVKLCDLIAEIGSVTGRTELKVWRDVQGRWLRHRCMDEETWRSKYLFRYNDQICSNTFFWLHLTLILSLAVKNCNYTYVFKDDSFFKRNPSLCLKITFLTSLLF